MSSTSFPVLAVSHLASNGPECEPSRSVRSTRSAEKSSQNTGPMSPAMTISEPSPPIASEQMELLPLAPSVEASPVKIFHSLARVRAWLANAAAFGLSTDASFANLDQTSLSWRTSQSCLLGVWETFSGRWPRSGMMQNGTAYRLPTLVSGTFGTECGLWPTPNATAFKGGRSSPRRGVANPEKNNWQDWCSLVLGQRYPVPETGEQVMGFSTGHTEIRPSEMQSFPKSQSLSDVQS